MTSHVRPFFHRSQKLLCIFCIKSYKSIFPSSCEVCTCFIIFNSKQLVFRILYLLIETFIVIKRPFFKWAIYWNSHKIVFYNFVLSLMSELCCLIEEHLTLKFFIKFCLLQFIAESRIWFPFDASCWLFQILSLKSLVYIYLL